MHIPYISIKADHPFLKPNELFELNIHPPIAKLNKAIIDMVIHYKWNFVFVLFQDPDRVVDLIKFSEYSEYREQRIKFQFRILDNNMSYWSELLNEVKHSGCSHVVIDLKSNMINNFLNIVSFFHYKK